MNSHAGSVLRITYNSVIHARGLVRPRLAALKEMSVTDLDPSARMLGLRLGLGDLNARSACKGYQHGCPCRECRERSTNVNPSFKRWLTGNVEAMPVYRRAPQAPAQPWDSRSAA